MINRIFVLLSLIVSFAIHAGDIPILTAASIKVTQNAKCTEGPGVQFEALNVRLIGQKDKQVHFGMNIAQYGKWLDLWQTTGAGKIVYDPSFYKNEKVFKFCYTYDLLKKKGKADSLFRASFMAIDTAKTEVIANQDVVFMIGSNSAPLVIKGAGKKYRVTATVVLTNKKMNISKAVIAMPLPIDIAPYQQVLSVSAANAKILTTGKENDKYARFEINSLPAGQTGRYTIEYTVLMNDITTPDFTELVPAYAYNVRSPIFINNTVENSPFVETTDSRIKKKSDELWNNAWGNPVLYAQMAYNYVANNSRYQSAMTGLHPLKQILNDGGGDCGNLSSHFISLMRAKGVPARHLVGYIPNKTWHAWSEIYFEGYGWIPVDVTYKNGDRSGNFFGNMPKGEPRLIFHRDVNVNVDLGGQKVKMPILQTFAYWVWGTGNTNTDLAADIKISAVQVR